MKVKYLNDIVAKTIEGMSFDNYADMLAMCGRGNLYRFSPRDQIAIFAQDPTATCVASYAQWQQVGRGGNHNGAMGGYPKTDRSWCENLFDVSKTHGDAETIPQLWKITPEQLEQYGKTIGIRRGFVEGLPEFLSVFAKQEAECCADKLNVTVDEFSDFVTKCSTYVILKRSGVETEVPDGLEEIWNKIPGNKKEAFLSASQSFIQRSSLGMLYRMGEYVRSQEYLRDKEADYGKNNDRGKTTESGTLQGVVGKGTENSTSGRSDRGTEEVQNRTEGIHGKDSEGGPGYVGTDSDRGGQSGRSEASGDGSRTNLGGRAGDNGSGSSVGGDNRRDDQGDRSESARYDGSNRGTGEAASEQNGGIQGTGNLNRGRDDSEESHRPDYRHIEEYSDERSSKTPGRGDSDSRSAASSAGDLVQDSSESGSDAQLETDETDADEELDAEIEDTLQDAPEAVHSHVAQPTQLSFDFSMMSQGIAYSDESRSYVSGELNSTDLDGISETIEESEPSPDSVSYAEGDMVTIDGTEFRINKIDEHHVTMQDLSLQYPIERVEPRDQFDKLVQKTNKEKKQKATRKSTSTRQSVPSVNKSNLAISLKHKASELTLDHQKLLMMVLQSGGGKDDSKLRIYYQYLVNRTPEQISDFLMNEYSATGKGFIWNGQRISVWTDENGMKLAYGTTVREDCFADLSWPEVEKAVRQLVNGHKYIDYSENAEVEGYIRDRLTERIWYLLCDFEREACPMVLKEAYNASDFPESTKRISEMLSNKENHQAIISDLINFMASVQVGQIQNRAGKRDKVVQRISDLIDDIAIYCESPRVSSLADFGENSIETRKDDFITDDEVEWVISKRGSDYENGNFRIYDYFHSHTNIKDCSKMIRNEYGTGGGCPGLPASDHSTKSYDGKGLKFGKGGITQPSAVLKLSWDQVTKITRKLIDEGRYFTETQFALYEEWKLRKESTIREEVNPLEDLKEDEIEVVEEAGAKDTVEMADENPSVSEEEVSEKTVYNNKISFVVAECSEFHTMGELHEDVATLNEAIQLWENIPKDRMNGIKSIGIEYFDEENIKLSTDILIGNRIDLFPLSYTPELANNPEALDAIAQLIERFPDAEITEEIPKSIEERLHKNEIESPQPSVQDVTEVDDVESIPLSEEVVVEIEEPENLVDFSYSEEWLPNTGSDRVRCQANIEAIKTLKEIEKRSGAATPEEQQILSQYVGWGGLSGLFDESKTEWTEFRNTVKNLLTEEEYSAARATVTDSFYTPREVSSAIHDALARFGFEKGNILEPSMGIGNFYSSMPVQMKEQSHLYGVELDPISARISKQLHPFAKIQNSGLENTEFSSNTFDVVIGNVPFGDYKVYDKKFKNQNFLIHDYFLAKSIDLCAPGGICALVTTKGTLDKKNSKVRQYLSERATLVGAIRLPNTTFADSANTEATSDILFFQKKERQSLDENLDWIDLDMDENFVPVNQYFIDHPEMLCGLMKKDEKRFGAEHAITYMEPFEDGTLEEHLKKAVEQLPSGIYTEAKKKIEQTVTNTDTKKGKKTKVLETIPADSSVRNFTFTVRDNQLYYRRNALFEKPIFSKEDDKRIRGMSEIRDVVRELISMQVDGVTDYEFDQKREELHSKYDAFVDLYGSLNEEKNKKLFHDDVDGSLLGSIEKNENGIYIKSDIFFKRTIRPKVEHNHAETALEALNITIAEKGWVDIDYIQKLYPVEFEQLVSELNGHIFLNPERMSVTDPKAGWESAEEYLSGEVRQKLNKVKLYHDAESNLPLEEQKFASNVEYLTKVQPKDLEATEIDVRFGSTWIDIEDYRDFAFEVLRVPYYQQRGAIKFHFDSYSNTYSIEGKGQVDRNIRATDEFGTPRANALFIMERLLNLGEIKVYDKVLVGDDYKRILNQEETIKAQAKADVLKDRFKKWVFEDYDRRNKYVSRYNNMFNGIRTRSYDGSNMLFPGMNPMLELKDYQKNAVARVVRGGNTLLAHCVGAGKSFEMAASCMELKRLGLANKPLIVVPNNLVPQMTNEFLTLYPNANLLMTTDKDFEKNNRRRFMGKIAAGEYDAVIMGHSQFGLMKLSKAREKFYIEEEIAEIRQALSEAEDRWSVKTMESTLKKMVAQLNKLSDTGGKDDFLDFEELGVDALFMDEAHLYKNLQFNTKLSRVAGVNTSNSGRSYDLFMKIRYLNELTPNRNIVFATGTPVSNSMTEMYVMQKYLRPDRLRDKGLYHFDSWAGTFGETVTAFELKPAGDGFQEKTRFAKFVNLPELQALYHEFADVQLPSMLDLKVPKLENDAYDVVECPKNYQIENKMAELVERAKAIKNGTVDPSEDNMLKICSEAKKLSTDIRLLEPDADPYEDGKLFKCVDNIYKIYQETMEQKSIQIVFSDMGVPTGKKDGKFCVYDFIKEELVKKGMPADEICFIQDAKNKLEKEKLYQQLRNGEKRVIIGSTETMGTGTNIQKRAIAMHEIDVPWRPSDVEQREGRIIRQGNENDRVRIFRYVTKDTFDAYNWSIIENKQKFISQVMTNKQVSRSCEDVDEAVLNYAEMKAAATGDPRIKQLIDVSAEVRKLKVQRDAFTEDKYRLEREVREIIPNDLAKCRKNLSEVRDDLENRNGNSDFKKLTCENEADRVMHVTIRGMELTERVQIGEQMLSILNKGVEIGKRVPVGSFSGFEIGFDRTMEKTYIYMKGVHEYFADASYSAKGIPTVLTNLLKKMSEVEKNFEQRETELKDRLEQGNIILEADFPKEQEYQDAIKLQKKLERELASDEEEYVGYESTLMKDDKPLFAIYQLKDDEEHDDELHYYHYASFDEMASSNRPIKKENYDCKYCDDLTGYENLDDIFVKFNDGNRPNDFEGHSLSVSDVVVIKNGNQMDSFYVDRIGFKELPGFMDGKEILANDLIQAEEQKNDTQPQRTVGWNNRRGGR